MVGRNLDLGNPLADHPLNYGLVGWWAALPNTRGGTRLYDLCDARNHAVWSSAPNWCGGLPSNFGGCRLTGSGPTLVTAASSAFSTATATVTTLLRTTTGTGFGNHVARDDGSSNRQLQYRNDNSNHAQLVWFDTGGAQVVSGTKTLNDGLPHVITGTYGASNAIKQYFDGNPDGTGTGSGSLNSGGTLGLSIGITNGASLPYTGDVFMVRWHNWALSASEAWNEADQMRRGCPDLLRWWDRRVYSFSPPDAAPAFDASTFLEPLPPPIVRRRVKVVSY